MYYRTAQKSRIFYKVLRFSGFQVLTIESFHVKCSSFVEVCARTDPDLPSLEQIGDSARTALWLLQMEWLQLSTYSLPPKWPTSHFVDQTYDFTSLGWPSVYFQCILPGITLQDHLKAKTIILLLCCLSCAGLCWLSTNAYGNETALLLLRNCKNKSQLSHYKNLLS